MGLRKRWISVRWVRLIQGIHSALWGLPLLQLALPCLPDNCGVASRTLVPQCQVQHTSLDVGGLRAARSSVEAQPAGSQCQAHHGLPLLKSACNDYTSALLPRPPRESCISRSVGSAPAPPWLPQTSLYAGQTEVLVALAGIHQAARLSPSLRATSSGAQAP